MATEQATYWEEATGTPATLVPAVPVPAAERPSVELIAETAAGEAPTDR